MKNLMPKFLVTVENIKEKFNEQGASEMVAVVVLIVLVIAISVVALPGVRGVLIQSFRNITTGIQAVGSTGGL